MTEKEVYGQAFENGRAVGDAEGYARGLKEARVVDAVEVVRCKDCCHYRKTTDWDGGSYYACHKRAAVMIMEMKAADFCSYGERRNDNA